MVKVSVQCSQCLYSSTIIWMEGRYAKQEQREGKGEGEGEGESLCAVNGK
jgi:hypothetical protein